MGDNFLRQQVRSARRRQDRARAEDGQPRLFVRSELVDITYPIRPLDGHRFAEGDMLFGVAVRRGSHIDVSDGQRRLGVSEGDAAHALRDELAKPGGLGAVRLQVCAVGAISGVAQARILPEGRS
jgi:hypothetical protein